MRAALNASMDRQKVLQDQMTPKQRVLELGRKMEKLMVELTARMESLQKELDDKEHSLYDLAGFINQLHDTKMVLLKVFAEWHKLQGPRADPAVATSIANLELCANKLINDIKIRMETVKEQLAAVTRPKLRLEASGGSKEAEPSNPVPVVVSELPGGPEA